MDLDEMLWLQGDEDGGVGVNCRECNRGGLPIVYYQGVVKAYENVDVVIVGSIEDLMTEAKKHVEEHGRSL